MSLCVTSAPPPPVHELQDADVPGRQSVPHRRVLPTIWPRFPVPLARNTYILDVHHPRIPYGVVMLICPAALVQEILSVGSRWTGTPEQEVSFSI